MERLYKMIGETFHGTVQKLMKIGNGDGGSEASV